MYAVAGRVKDEDIALVRDRTSIADVISETVTLRSAGGGNLKGLCPFHDEKTPSFTVSPARNVYFCHGCGAGGDAIKFLMDAEHLTFIESVERLAGRAGIQLRYDESGRRARPAPAARAEAAADRRARRRRRVLPRPAQHARRPQGPRVPRPARLRPGRRREVRLRLRPRRLGPAHQAPAAEGLHRRGADHRRAGQAGPVRLADRPVPPPAALADPGPDRRRHRLRRAQALRRRRRPEVPEHPGVAALQEVARALRHRPRQAGDRQAGPGGDRRGLHRRDGLPRGRRADRRGHLRHRVRRRPHRGAAPAADGQRQLHRRDHLHLRR